MSEESKYELICGFFDTPDQIFLDLMCDFLTEVEGHMNSRILDYQGYGPTRRTRRCMNSRIRDYQTICVEIVHSYSDPDGDFYFKIKRLKEFLINDGVL